MGALGMSLAERLAREAAQRSGAGMVIDGVFAYAFTEHDVVQIIRAALDEAATGARKVGDESISDHEAGGAYAAARAIEALK
jgi:hypothetical protein